MFVCTECWNEELKWQWQCPSCKAWNTLKEFKEAKLTKSSLIAEAKELTKLSNTELKEEKIITSSKELNTVLWWWIVKSSTILLSWEPWIWKSTLSIQLAKWIKNKKIIYVSWEETEYQIINRANRLKIKNENLSILSESNLENILKTLEKNSSDLVIIDSISVINSAEISWVAWSISQVRYITEKLIEFAKNFDTSIVIIWHITKDWTLAWPKTLEHMVDTVLFFEGDKFDNLRILRALKNRFWATSEVWLFKMEEFWLQDLKNPWMEFLSSKTDSVWSSLSITIEGTRALVIETESLTTYTKFGYPKRSARWIFSSKLDLIIAVLLKYTNIKLDAYDVYVNIARWLKIEEPWVDLSIAASIISSKINKKISKDYIFIWEISLTWKIKKIYYIEKRIKEAQKLWFKKIFISDIELKQKFDIEIIKINNIEDLVKKIIEN